MVKVVIKPGRGAGQEGGEIGWEEEEDEEEEGEGGVHEAVPCVEGGLLIESLWLLRRGEGAEGAGKRSRVIKELGLGGGARR